MNWLDVFIFLQLSESKFQSVLYLAEDLILKVVRNISYELDSFNKKRKWDHIIVNQFLRDLREAKKRGNSERRHKEALAILAATAPSVVPISRNATVRKETENNVTSAKREVITVLCLFSCFLSGIIVFLLTYVCFLNMPRSIVGSSRIGQLSSSPQEKDLSFSNSKF